MFRDWRLASILPKLVWFGTCSLFLVGPSFAEPVEFEASKYYCDKVRGYDLGGGLCEIDVTPDERACYELGRYGLSLDDVRGEFCGRQTTRKLLSFSQYARTQAMSYVSLGKNESICDPQRNPGNSDSCNQPAYQAYFLYMCAAYICTYE